VIALGGKQNRKTPVVTGWHLVEVEQNCRMRKQ
jgi:hypothetical protein